MADLSSFQCIEMAIFNTASLGASFSALNGASSYSLYTGSGFQDDIKILKIYNASTVGITISYDGVTNHDFFPSGATIIIDLQANHENNSAYGSGTKNGRKGQILFGKGSAGTGNLYISGYR